MLRYLLVATGAMLLIGYLVLAYFIWRGSRRHAIGARFATRKLITFRGGEPAGDDPWEGNTLEWATSSPPPPYNFDHLPPIRSERPVFDRRHANDAPALTAGH